MGGEEAGGVPGPTWEGGRKGRNEEGREGGRERGRGRDLKSGSIKKE